MQELRVKCGHWNHGRHGWGMCTDSLPRDPANILLAVRNVLQTLFCDLTWLARMRLRAASDCVLPAVSAHSHAR